MKYIYNGQELDVDKKIADYLEEDRKREQAEQRSDRRHLTNYEITENTYDELVDKQSGDFTDEIVKADLEALLHEAINTLTPVQKRRIALCFFDDMNYAQIAGVEGISEKNVRKSIQAALEKLKNFLE